MLGLYKIFLLLLLNSLILLNTIGCEQMDISKYKGDGKIVSIGRKPFTSGYIIQFKDFDLTKNFSDRYKIVDYPKIDKQLVDISIGGKGEYAHRISVHIPYEGIYKILHNIVGDKVQKAKLL